MREDIQQSTADNEVLLDLEILYPWRFTAPLRDVVPGDQSSASTSTFT